MAKKAEKKTVSRKYANELRQEIKSLKSQLEEYQGDFPRYEKLKDELTKKHSKEISDLKVEHAERMMQLRDELAGNLVYEDRYTDFRNNNSYLVTLPDCYIKIDNRTPLPNDEIIIRAKAKHVQMTTRNVTIDLIPISVAIAE